MDGPGGDALEPLKALTNSFPSKYPWISNRLVRFPDMARRTGGWIVRCTLLLGPVDKDIFGSRSEFRIIEVLKSFLDMLTGFKIIP